MFIRGECMIKNVADWNPDAYLKFKNERTLPSVDLVGRIEGINPATIIDVGCGPGNSTQVLSARWQAADILGIDNSPAMIEKAKQDYPDQKWEVMDARTIGGKYDLVYSNATLQWIGDHANLMPSLFGRVNSGGAFAVQIPSYFEMPVKKAIDRVAAALSVDRRADQREPSAYPVLENLMTIHPLSAYYDLLAGQAKKIDLWKTSYFHVMESLQAIVDMIRTTGMKPFLDALATAEEKTEFESLVLKELRTEYDVRGDGKVLFPFERLFFIAYA